MDISRLDVYYYNKNQPLPHENQMAIRTIIGFNFPRYLDNEKEEIFNLLTNACRIITRFESMNGRTVITFSNYHFDVQLLRTDQAAVRVPE